MDISGQDEFLNVADSLEKLSAIGKKARIDAIFKGTCSGTAYLVVSETFIFIACDSE